MGNMQAAAYAAMARDEGYDLDVVLTAHLQSNHFPPIDPHFVPVAREAIEHANAGDYQHLITLPEGATVNGEGVVSVDRVIQDLHLDAFLDQDEDGEDGF